MTKRFIMVLMLICFVGFNVTGCSGSESKKDSVKTADVPALDKSKLENKLQQKKYKMVEFGGRHCIPCKKMQPILAELSESYGDSISIVTVYVQEQLQLGRDYKVRLIPTQVIFDKEGKEVFRHTGFWEKSEILAKWKELKII